MNRTPSRYHADELLAFAAALLSRSGLPADRVRVVELHASVLPSLAAWAERFDVAVPTAMGG